MIDIVYFFENISSLQRSLILISGITFFWSIETIIPLFKFNYKKFKHAIPNFFFTLTTVIVNFSLAFLLLNSVLRNVGVPFSHTIIAISSTIKGINKLIVNKTKIDSDLNENWAVIAEAIQTVLRREGYPNPYEVLKELTRINSEINKKTIHEFIDSLEIENKIKNELKKISPSNYTGI